MTQTAMEKTTQIWDREHECMSRDELETLQLQRLQQTLERVNNHVPCYQNKFGRPWIECG